MEVALRFPSACGNTALAHTGQFLTVPWCDILGGPSCKILFHQQLKSQQKPISVLLPKVTRRFLLLVFAKFPHSPGFSAGQVWEHNGGLQQCHPAPLLRWPCRSMKPEETSAQYPHIYLILAANPDFQMNFWNSMLSSFGNFGHVLDLSFIFACFTVNSPNIQWIQWFSEVSKWDIWDLHLCERAADLLGVTYSSSSYSSATGTLHGCLYDSLLTAADAVQRMKSMGWGQ